MDGGQTWEINNNTQVTIDGTSFLMYFYGSGSTATMKADMDGDGAVEASQLVNRIYTRYSGSDGYLWLKADSSNDSTPQISNFTQFITEKLEDDRHNGNSDSFQEQINWTFSWDATNDKLKLASPVSTFGSNGDMRKLENKDVYVGWSLFGIWGEYDYTNAEQPSFKFTYPDTQAETLVYVTSGATTTSSSSSGGLTTDVVQFIDVGAVKLASEVTNPSSGNLIIVGGPCANSVARTVMGVTSASCADGFEPGKAMVKLYEHAPGKVAMVVAGYSAIDTRRASQVVANYKDYATTFKGSEVEVTTVTSTPTVAAPSVMEEPVMDEE
jgi:hypothetical protein